MVESKLNEIFTAVLELGIDKINSEMSTDNTEQWDSIKHLMLMNTIEEEFNIQLNDEDLLNLTSYKAIKNRIEEK